MSCSLMVAQTLLKMLPPPRCLRTRATIASSFLSVPSMVLLMRLRTSAGEQSFWKLTSDGLTTWDIEANSILQVCWCSDQLCCLLLIRSAFGSALHSTPCTAGSKEQDVGVQAGADQCAQEQWPLILQQYNHCSTCRSLSSLSANSSSLQNLLYWSWSVT